MPPRKNILTRIENDFARVKRRSETITAPPHEREQTGYTHIRTVHRANWRGQGRLPTANYPMVGRLAGVVKHQLRRVSKLRADLEETEADIEHNNSLTGKRRDTKLLAKLENKQERLERELNRIQQDPVLYQNLFARDALITMFPGGRIRRNHTYSIKVRYTKDNGGPGQDKERWFRIKRPGELLLYLENSERAIADIFGKLNDTDKYGYEDSHYDFQVVSIEDMGVEGEVRSREAIAHHRFGIRDNEIEQKFYMAPLRLHDFPCIYESLMIIKAFIESGGQKPLFYTASWIEYVLFSFNQEKTELMQSALTGLVTQTIDLFNEAHNLNIGFFNLHRYREFYSMNEHAQVMVDMKDEEELAQTKLPHHFFLAYWRSHVFPIQYSQLGNIKAYMDKYIARFTTPNTRFCVVPGVAKFVESLIKIRKINGSTYEQLPASIKRMDLRLLLPCLETKNISHVENYHKYFERCQQLAYTTNEEIFDAIDADPFDESQVKAAFHSYYVQHGRGYMISDDEVTTEEERSEFLRRRYYKFDKLGWCGLDIETLVDNSLTDYHTNFRPYCLSIYGRLVRLERAPTTNSLMRWRTRMVDVPRTTFFGLDCVQQFVTFLVTNNFIEGDINYQNDFAGSAAVASQKRKRFRNYFFAHNGFKFDYRFLYEEIYSKIGDMVLIGDMQQTKSFFGQGLYFLDTALFFPSQLASLAEQFFPNDPTRRKLDGDIAISMSIDMFHQLSQEQITQIKTYCEQDAFLVQQIALSFFNEVYLTPFGHGFTKNFAYHSAPALAWDIWQNCFLTVPVFINPHTQFAEKASYRGGLAMVTKMYVEAAVVYDITSSYPASMCVDMPLLYVNEDAPPEDFDVGVARGKNEDVLEDQNLYLASFSFPRDCLRPTIAIRTKDTMICPQNCFDNGEIHYEWLWGVELKQAVRLGDATILIKKRIQYVRKSTHKDFIEFMFTQRYKHPESEHPIKNRLYKLLMNSQYGKHGQQEFDTTLMGSEVYTSEMLSMLDLQHEEINNLRVEQVPTNNIDIYQIKFRKNNSENNYKGTTVRFASYITAKSRCQLFEGIYAIANVYGLEHTAYTDTDSIHIEIAGREREIAVRIRAIAEDSTLDSVEQYMLIREQFLLSRVFSDEVRNLRIRYVKSDDDSETMPFFDDSELGAFKQEKLIITGAYTGPKQYAYNYIVYYSDEYISKFSEEKKRKVLCIKTDVKLKGVPPKSRDVDAVRELVVNMQNLKRMETIEQIDQLSAEELPVRPFYIQSVFYRIGTGISIAPALKYIRPTLSKCTYDLETGIGYPFETITDFFKHRDNFTKLMEHAKQRYKDLLPPNPFINALENIQLIDSHKKAAKLSRKVYTYGFELREELSPFVEARKRFIASLPRIKYAQIHDDLYRILKDKRTIIYYYSYLYPLFVNSLKCIKNMKAATKKGLYINNGYNEQREDKLRKIDDLDSAKICAFMMFVNFICRMHKLPISEKLDRIFKSIGLLNQTFLRDDFMEAHKYAEKIMWQKNIAYSLHFLSVPIAIEKVGEHEQEVYTNLWRIFRVIMNRIYHESSEMYEQSVSSLASHNLAQMIETAEYKIFEEQQRRELAEIAIDEFIARQEEEEDNGDNTEVIRFRTQVNQPTIKIIKAAVIARPEEQPPEMVQMRENMNSEQLDVGTHVLHKNNMHLVQDEEEKGENNDEFDRLGLLVERHSVLGDIIEDEAMLRTVAQQAFITLDDNVEGFVGVTKRAQLKIRDQYKDMLNIICKIFLFLVHMKDEALPIYRKCMKFFRISMPNSPAQQLFKATETIYSDNTILGNGMPTKNTSKAISYIINVFIAYVHEGSQMTFDDFYREIAAKTTTALWTKLQEIERDERIREEIQQIGALHTENEQMQYTITRILMNDIDNDVMLSELQKQEFVFGQILATNKELEKDGLEPMPVVYMTDEEEKDGPPQQESPVRIPNFLADLDRIIEEDYEHEMGMLSPQVYYARYGTQAHADESDDDEGQVIRTSWQRQQRMLNNRAARRFFELEAQEDEDYESDERLSNF